MIWSYIDLNKYLRLHSVLILHSQIERKLVSESLITFAVVSEKCFRPAATTSVKNLIDAYVICLKSTLILTKTETIRS